MGLSRICADFSILKRIAVILLIGTAVGCQATPPPDLSDRMAAHLANIDPSGLSRQFDVPELDARVAIPRGWHAMAADVTPLYVHQQWRSPDRTTGVGVVYAHMPLPMSAKALVFLARTQYSQQLAHDHRPDAQLFREWTDSLSREWFEGENVKYHVRGYVVTSGFNAWAVYSGYRLRSPPDRQEMNLAFRSMDSIVPIPLAVTN